MAIEDFEWEGELRDETRVRPRKPSVWARLAKSVWVEPALKLGGMGALLGVLAGIGVVATTYAKPGIPLPEGPRAFAAALGTSWLKPTPAEPAHSSAPTRGQGLAAAPSASATPGPASSAGAATSEPGSAAPAVGITPDGKIILNVASAEELTKLPGVGMKRAQAIVALRAKLKRFKSATELLRVKGIGPKGLQRMLPHLVLDSQVKS